MAGYLASMLFALISTLIACLELNAALINFYTLILRKRQSLVTKTDVFLSVFGGQVWTVENAAKTLVWTKNFLSVFKKQKTEVFENALVWTGHKTIPDSLHLIFISVWLNSYTHLKVRNIPKKSEFIKVTSLNPSLIPFSAYFYSSLFSGKACF